MFFLWDIIFGTALITRQYPKAYGISHYQGDQWYAQLLWPIFKSKVEGSELAAAGPMVRIDIDKEDNEQNHGQVNESKPALVAVS